MELCFDTIVKNSVHIRVVIFEALLDPRRYLGTFGGVDPGIQDPVQKELNSYGSGAVLAVPKTFLMTTTFDMHEGSKFVGLKAKIPSLNGQPNEWDDFRFRLESVAALLGMIRRWRCA